MRMVKEKIDILAERKAAREEEIMTAYNSYACTEDEHELFRRILYDVGQKNRLLFAIRNGEANKEGTAALPVPDDGEEDAGDQDSKCDEKDGEETGNYCFVCDGRGAVVDKCLRCGR